MEEGNFAEGLPSSGGRSTGSAGATERDWIEFWFKVIAAIVALAGAGVSLAEHFSAVHRELDLRKEGQTILDNEWKTKMFDLKVKYFSQALEAAGQLETTDDPIEFQKRLNNFEIAKHGTANMVRDSMDTYNLMVAVYNTGYKNLSENKLADPIAKGNLTDRILALSNAFRAELAEYLPTPEQASEVATKK